METKRQVVEIGGGDAVSTPAHQDRLVLLGRKTTSHSVPGVPAYPSVNGGKPTYECVCRFCEEMFLAGKPHAKVCKRVECRRAMWRESTARDYSKNAAVRIASMTKWRMEHPDRWDAIRLKTYTRKCTRCGLARWTKSAAERRQPEFICRSCLAQQRKAERMTPCSFCGAPFFRTRLGERSRCVACVGALTRAGERLGLTRERIRQLVNAKVAKVGGTKADALRLVLADRGGAS